MIGVFGNIGKAFTAKKIFTASKNSLLRSKRAVIPIGGYGILITNEDELIMWCEEKDLAKFSKELFKNIYKRIKLEVRQEVTSVLRQKKKEAAGTAGATL